MYMYVLMGKSDLLKKVVTLPPSTNTSGQEQDQEYIKIIEIWGRNGTTDAITLTATGKLGRVGEGQKIFNLL